MVGGFPGSKSKVTEIGDGVVDGSGSDFLNEWIVFFASVGKTAFLGFGVRDSLPEIIGAKSETCGDRGRSGLFDC